MRRGCYNFSAGPAALPSVILEQAQKELLNWENSGVSIMEMGHRSSEVQDLMAQTEALFKEVLSIPPEYHVLMLGGAARLQFAMAAMNFIAKQQSAAYVVSGIWSKMAYDECQHLERASCIASSEAQDYISLPIVSPDTVSQDLAYLYYTSNETVNGVQFKSYPISGSVPLISDMTSSLLTEPVDIQQHALIFAGAQKNIANAGMTVVIVSDALLRSIPNDKLIATMMDYRVHAKHKSLYATPPVFNCYLANKMLHWIIENGGVEEMQLRCIKKSSKLYQYIDESAFYDCKIAFESRSNINVCFNITNEKLENAFLDGAKKQGLLALKGHRSVGGMRASLYNSMPESGVNALIEYMHSFAKEHS